MIASLKMTKIRKKPGDPIYVAWKDALTKTCWMSVSDISEDGDENCYTRGWFIKETKDNIFVTCTKGKTMDEDVLGYLQIPKAWIKKVR